LRTETGRPAGFTVILRGARRFALLVDILGLAFIVVFGFIQPSSVRGIFAGYSTYRRLRLTELCNES